MKTQDNGRPKILELHLNGKPKTMVDLKYWNYTFYLRLYGVGHMVKDDPYSERRNPLPPHGLPFPINSKGSFICTNSQTG